MSNIQVNKWDSSTDYCSTWHLAVRQGAQKAKRRPEAKTLLRKARGGRENNINLSRHDHHHHSSAADETETVRLYSEWQRCRQNRSSGSHTIISWCPTFNVIPTFQKVFSCEKFANQYKDIIPPAGFFFLFTFTPPHIFSCCTFVNYSSSSWAEVLGFICQYYIYTLDTFWCLYTGCLL